MRLLLTLLMLMTALLPAAHAEANDMYTLFLATDLHFISPALTDHGAYFTNMVDSADGKMTSYVNELTDAFIAQVIDKKPDALVLSGDLTFNGARKSHEDLAGKLQAVREAGIPVYVIPGNHDLYRYSAASFSGDGYTRVDSVTAEEFAEIYRDFGFDAALSRDPYSLSYAAELMPGVRLVMLDVNTQSMQGAATHSALSWVERELQAAHSAGEKIIAVSHQNLFAHSSLLSKGYVIENASLLLSYYERYGVAINLSGHLHMQHTAQSENGLPEIATSSLSVSPCQYGVIEIEGGTAQYHTETVDVAAWAKATGQTDENLLHFSEYAADYFAATAVRQALAQLGDDPDADAMAAWLSELNAAYFSGRMDTVDPANEYAARWTAGDSFFARYVLSILSEELKDHTKLRFSL